MWELYDLANDFNESPRPRVPNSPSDSQTCRGAGGTRPATIKCCPSTIGSANASPRTRRATAGARTNFTFWSGMGHVPSEVAPDLRSRSYEITAHINPSGSTGARDGVLIAHGDATCGYSLFVRDGHLVHDLNIGGTHQTVSI